MIRTSECGETLDSYRNDTGVAINAAACADMQAERYNEFCQRAIKAVRHYGKNLDQYYRHHPFYPATAIVIETASFLRNLSDDNENTQKAFMRDLVLLGCLLETESSQGLRAATTMVGLWPSGFKNSSQNPFKTYKDQQTDLLQVALLRRVLGASGGTSTKATERFIGKSTPSRSLELIGAAIGVRGRYSRTESDTKGISAALTGHALFKDQDTSQAAIEVRLRELRRHVPIAYPSIVSHSGDSHVFD